MSQSRKHSAYEAIINVVVGFSINFMLNMLVFPLFGWEISAAQNIALGVIYTVISIARSYSLRRVFNRWHQYQKSHG
jgi:hypothetical protein